MLPYKAVFHKALCARMVHTTPCDLRRQRGPQYDAGMEMLVKGLKLPQDQLDNLNYDDVEDMNDQNASSINAALHAVPGDLEKEKKFIMFKKIEQKYFRNQYKIKPGEAYNRNKDPFFKQGRDCKDFYHKHHDSIRKEAILAENTPTSVAIDDILTQSKYQRSPLNLFSSVEPPDSVEVRKASSRYTSTQSFLSSPDEAYHSPSIYHDSDQLKVPKLVAAATIESTKIPAEEELSHNSFSDYNGPCLMLWSMKEQMRYLNGTDPVYWNPEMLTTIFPINVDNVKKLLKSRWVPENEQEVAKHDSRVLDHWKQLSGGKLRSHALVTKAIQNRLQTTNKPVSGLPVPSAVNDQMLDILGRLQFEHPEQARRQGLSPVRLPSNGPPEHGYFADIVRNYKAKVDALHNKTCGDDSTTVDLYSSELDVVSALPPPPSYEGRAVAVRGVATSPKTAIERHQRTASLKETQKRGFFRDNARSQQLQQEVMRRPLLQNTRPGLERLKLMEEEDRLELGVSRGSDHDRHGRPHSVAEAVIVDRRGRPQHGNDEAVSVGRHGKPQHGDGEAVTRARSESRHYIVEKSVGEPRKKHQLRNKNYEDAKFITYDQFVKQRGKEIHQEIDYNKKQDGYFDL